MLIDLGKNAHTVLLSEKSRHHVCMIPFYGKREHMWVWARENESVLIHTNMLTMIILGDGT